MSSTQQTGRDSLTGNLEVTHEELWMVDVSGCCGCRVGAGGDSAGGGCRGRRERAARAYGGAGSNADGSASASADAGDVLTGDGRGVLARNENRQAELGGDSGVSHSAGGVDISGYPQAGGRPRDLYRVGAAGRFLRGDSVCAGEAGGYEEGVGLCSISPHLKSSPLKSSPPRGEEITLTVREGRGENVEEDVDPHPNPLP
jgi:hypothetical protein